MTGFVEAVAGSVEVELERLGSQKSLLALTRADLSPEAVLTVAAASERAARETFAAWADDEADPDAAAAFADLAAREADHYERVVAELDGGEPPPSDPDPMQARLRECEATAERLGGLAGRTLVADRTLLQVVNFFVNEADERRADLFRELRAETEPALDVATDHLEGRDEASRERARAAAVDVVRAAYGEYADALEGMGVDPRPVC
ncbi:MAG: rubrerythrin family protein [Halobacteriaceae archaeon]